MEMKEYPKLLIISRGVWDDTKGTSSTLTNLFEDYDPEKLAHIYIESIVPNTKCCHRFYQISEFSLIHKLYKWNTRTGFAFDTENTKIDAADSKLAENEVATMDYVRGHRSIWFSFAREILWAFNGWKSKELKQFISDFDPDVVWMDGSPLPLMNKLYLYILKVVNCPAVIFLQDDVYTYKSCRKQFGSRIYKYLLRREVKKVIEKCNHVFVASPKMKQEYDSLFDINSSFIAKSVKVENLRNSEYKLHNPLRMVYLGQVIYGRIYSLIDIAESLKKINANGIKVQLFVYTNNNISDDLKQRLLVKDSVFLMPSVPYYEVSKVMSQNDVVVFVESFQPDHCNIARLSFSTKICDYLSSGKCIFAVGPHSIAPIEYLKDEDAAVVANSKEDIERQLYNIINQRFVSEYANRAFRCVRKNHDRNMMDTLVYGKLIELNSERHKNEKN